MMAKLNVSSMFTRTLRVPVINPALLNSEGRDTMLDRKRKCLQRILYRIVAVRVFMSRVTESVSYSID